MKFQDSKNFLKQIKEHNSNLIFLAGDNLEIKEIIESIKKDYTGDNTLIFFKDDVDNLISNLSMKTLFGSKLLIIYEIDTVNGKDYKKVLELIKKPERLRPNMVIMTYKDKKRIPKIKGSLKKIFRNVYDSDIPSWIKEYLKNKGYIINEKALSMFCFSMGADRDEIKKQIEIITSRKSDEDKIITENDVKNIGFHRKDTLFKITNSLIEKDYRTSIRYLMEYFDSTPLFYFINRDIRYLLVLRAAFDLKENIKRLNLGRKLNIHPYFLKSRYIPSAKGYKFENLEKQFDKIMDAEYKIKNGWDEFSINFNFISQLQ